ncbi:GGDEF domain-containing phosphodiesterase [Luteimonas sp. RD2P54]|uniref:GGDEF domain-containing phosphodiesterase n=1 Tax=Luteimonas endophytica TaxID=3042023 RepID=A0ABT6JE18_9GAMM|nr:GGDEF domain-containing phosphodiesterase [Luteimonas endophytica]MDH5824443.1 GGDEF domain-containing phosphodiesterase [Luteimonas endophytica]
MLNRAAVLRAVAAAIDSGRPGPGALGVLVVRSQRMRETELALGYAVGERVAAAMEAALVAALRPHDAVLRIGEYDFLLLLPALRSRQHAALAGAKLVRTLQQPVSLDGWQVQPSIAVGAALCPDHGDDPEQLCRRADRACDDALAGGEGFAFWQRPAIAAQFTHEELRDALAGNRLELYLQPILDLRAERVVGYEALARWAHPRIGPVAPPDFVGAAERTGLIGELTRWSLNVALRQVAQMRRAGRPVRVNVNLSAAALQLPGFVPQVLDLLRFWEVPPEGLVLEVTESALMRDVARCQALLAALRDAGVGISIDDFGTGYSSMAYLRQLPAGELKIDRSFVADMTEDRRSRRLVGSMIDLSHHLGLEVVAEGVEDAATLTLLRELGCDHAQGYLIGRPAPATETVAVAASAA